MEEQEALALESNYVNLNSRYATHPICVILGESLNLSVPLFPHLQDGNSSNTYQ